MVSIKTVAVAGASGNVGVPTIHALLAANFTVTALTREGSTATFPPGVKVVKVDYNSIPSLTQAFTGQDAVVVAINFMGLATQNLLVEAAAAASVKKFIPCEFGPNADNALARSMPPFASKVAIQELLFKKYEEMGMEYSFVYTGPFLDWGLRNAFIADLKKKTIMLYDGGDQEYTATMLPDIAKAITGCFLHLQETKNRAVYPQSVVTTQNTILKLLKKVNPGAQWNAIVVQTEDMEKGSIAALASGKHDFETMFGFVFRAHFGPSAYGHPWAKDDNELFGIKQMTEGDLEETIRQISQETTGGDELYRSLAK